MERLYLKKLYQYYNKTSFEKVIEKGKKLIRTQKTDKELLNIIGLSYDQAALKLSDVENKKKYQKKAKYYFKKIILIDSTCIKGWSGLGLVYLHQNNLKKSLVCYQKAFLLDKTDISVFVSLGNIYRAMKKYPQALRWYKKSLNTDIEDIKLTSLINIATMSQSAKKGKTAKKYALRALKIINNKKKPLDAWIVSFKEKIEKILDN